MLRSTLVLNIGKLNENRKPARCQLFTRGCLFGRLSMTTCKCKTSFDGELLLALSKLATHPPFMGQCKHAITISSLSLSASNLPIQSTRDKSSWSIVPRRRDFQLVDSENSWLLLSLPSHSHSVVIPSDSNSRNLWLFDLYLFPPNAQDKMRGVFIFSGNIERKVWFYGAQRVGYGGEGEMKNTCEVEE